jgi:hypothetical protein
VFRLGVEDTATAGEIRLLVNEFNDLRVESLRMQRTRISMAVGIFNGI